MLYIVFQLIKRINSSKEMKEFKKLGNHHKNFFKYQLYIMQNRQSRHFGNLMTNSSSHRSPGHMKTSGLITCEV